MKTFVLALLAPLAALGARVPPSDFYETRPVVDQSMVDSINADPESAFEAVLDPRFASMSVAEAKRMFGATLMSEEESKAWRAKMNSPFDEEHDRIIMADPLGSSIPESFDVRDKWPGVLAIENQEKCGSCWAFSAVQVLSARFAIVTNNATHVQLAAQDPVSCDHGNMGCNGGELPLVWQYLKNTGAVTIPCMPYTAGNGTVAACPTNDQCTDPSVQWKKYKAKSSYAVGGFFPWTRVKKIQLEIMNHGSVQTGFKVYSNFMTLGPNGIYNKIEGDLLGGHAVEIIGWGVQDNTPYWTVRNSWGSSWPTGCQGRECGTFKILRGKDLCGFEADVYAGLPDTSSV